MGETVSSSISQPPLTVTKAIKMHITSNINSHTDIFDMIVSSDAVKGQRLEATNSKTRVLQSLTFSDGDQIYSTQHRVLLSPSSCSEPTSL